MAATNSDERVMLQEKIKEQGEIVRKLKSKSDQTDESKQQVFINQFSKDLVVYTHEY